MSLPVSWTILRASVLYPSVLYSTNGKVLLKFLGLTSAIQIISGNSSVIQPCNSYNLLNVKTSVFAYQIVNCCFPCS